MYALLSGPLLVRVVERSDLQSSKLLSYRCSTPSKVFKVEGEPGFEPGTCLYALPAGSCLIRVAKRYVLLARLWKAAALPLGYSP